MLSNTYLAAVPILLSLSTTVAAWGSMGHQTVASVALQYLKPAAQDAVNQILTADPEGKENPDMMSVSTWADEYREKSGGHYTAPYHFIDAVDNPPRSCGVNFQRDCTAAGCVVSAMYTNRIQDSSMDPIYTAQALKFLIHFVADATQPLHDESKARGGNEISVKWNGRTAKLHHVWDTEMVEALAGSDTADNVAKWTDTIVTAVNPGGQYADSVAGWISCITPSMIGSVSATQSCATEWASDGNSYICSYVLNPDPSHKETDGAYFDGAAPIIQEQIAKVRVLHGSDSSDGMPIELFITHQQQGGVRLAALLNVIFTGSTGFDSGVAFGARFNIQTSQV
ncbi:hypothetical protein FRB95_007865 [Tulasnella sp. JGI-2019a]|nr:hypothetical protein FRB95_007865 [Tulasnella sp. JGI-2019a]